jgi:hypothetical protein
MKKFLVVLMIPFSVFAERSPEIKSWNEIIPEKGYILSNDLFYEKMCSNIWTKQIQEFKKMNPHISNPDLILVHQKIQVQDCRDSVEEEVALVNPVAVKQQPKEDENPWFVGAYIGGSFLSGKKHDTSKHGYSFGAKIGREHKLEDKTLQWAVGYFENTSYSRTAQDNLGNYKIKTPALSLEAAMLYDVGQKLKVGPMVTALISEDPSMSDSKKYRALSGYIGLDSLYPIYKKFDLEVNIQQAVDSRVNVLGNVGLKYKF